MKKGIVQITRVVGTLGNWRQPEVASDYHIGGYF